jgi:hypothetical protein
MYSQADLSSDVNREVARGAITIIVPKFHSLFILFIFDKRSSVPQKITTNYFTYKSSNASVILVMLLMIIIHASASFLRNNRTQYSITNHHQKHNSN